MDPLKPLILYAKPLVEKQKKILTSYIDFFKEKIHFPPGLAMILVGENPASLIYLQNKKKLAIALGMKSEIFMYPSDIKPDVVEQKVHELNQDPFFHGIIIQRPLPVHFDPLKVVYWVSVEKDVDGLHPLQVGKLELDDDPLIPCTALGVIHLLEHYGIAVEKKICAVLGRSRLVGKPLASLLLKKNATIIHCHSYTPCLSEVTKNADILFSAIGVPLFIDDTFVKKGAVLVDVGINKKNEKIVGDCHFNTVLKIVSAITPVPGGVGPMTVITLMSNTVSAAYSKHKLNFIKI